MMPPPRLLDERFTLLGLLSAGEQEGDIEETASSGSERKATEDAEWFRRIPRSRRFLSTSSRSSLSATLAEEATAGPAMTL